MHAAQVLLVDDDEMLLHALTQVIELRMSTVEVEAVNSAQEALGLLKEHEYGAIISDVRMPGIDGLALLNRVQEQYPDTPVLMITGHSDHQTAVQALRGGAYDYIAKPVDRDDFVAALYRALHTYQLRQQIKEQQRALERYVLSLERQVGTRAREVEIPLPERSERCIVTTNESQGRKTMSIEPEQTLETPDMYGRLRILRAYKHVAIVGFSADPYRPSHFVAVYLQAEGYDIVLVNPRYAGQTVLGKRVYASLTEARQAGEQIEIVDVFRKPQDLEPIFQEATQIGARVLWLQLGIRSDEIGHRAVASGMEFVQDHCIKMEHARFFGGLHTIGLNTGVILAKKL